MATNYPTSVDTPTDPTGSNTMDGVTGGAAVVHATQHANANDAYVAIQNAVGFTGAFNFQRKLTPTALKTANYTAVPGDFVLCDTVVTGAFTVLLPNAPANGTMVGLKYINVGAGLLVTYQCQGTDHINSAGGATSGVLTIKSQSETMQYQSSTGLWILIAGDGPLGQLDLRYAPITGSANYLQVANNLSDVTTKGTGRLNLRVPQLAAVQCVATANVNIASPGASVDGFSFVSSGLDTVLLTGQSTSSQNGTWVWNGASSALTRPADFASGTVLTTGRSVVILNGTVNIGSQWWLTVPSAGLTIDTTAQTWNSLNILGSTANESIIRANTLNQMGAPTAALSINSQRLTSTHSGILSTDAANIGQTAGSQRAYVVSGCAWTADAPASTLNGSMSAGVVMIAGISLTVAAVTAHAFTASRDTYIDLADNGDGTANVTYTGVVNNTISPALANSGTLLNTIRVAVVISTGSALTSTAASINQGNPAFATATSQGASTVAAGSNTAAWNATPLNVAAGANFAAGGGWVTIAHAAGATSTISYASVSSNTLTGVVGIAGTGTLSTGDVVTQVTPVNFCDMLGNPIFPTRPYPVMIGAGQVSNTITTTLTSAIPLPGMIAPFIVPAGPSRMVKVTFATPYLASSATAGTAISTATFAGATGVGQTQNKVAVTSDGSAITNVGYVMLAAGSYTANMTMTQGAAGTLTMGVTYGLNFIFAELV